jgi:hypothetical protein
MTRTSESENVRKIVKALQTRSNFSTKRIADLLMLDIEHNGGRIYGDVLGNVEMIDEIIKDIKKKKQND